MRRLAAALVVLAAALAGCDAPPTGGDPATAPRLTILAPTMDRVLEVPAGKDPTVDDRPEALAGLSAAEAGERRRRALPVHVVLDLQNYAIGRVEDGGDGQHVHVVLDDEPYVAVYDVTRGLRLDPRRMTPGTHVLRVFPSAGPRDRAGALHHEARKNPDLLVDRQDYVKVQLPLRWLVTNPVDMIFAGAEPAYKSQVGTEEDEVTP